MVRGQRHVCSPGRLPQIIRIGKCHARLLVIGGMLCVPSCFWLAWVRHVSCMAAFDWWDVMCAILLLAGVGEAGGPGEEACLQSRQATTDHQNW